MDLIYKGKTKDVYALDNGDCLLKFKDDVTGTDGVFDPGANTVGLSIEGGGKAGLGMTAYFFALLEKKGVKTHFVSADIPNATMTVKRADKLGQGLEVICRYRAVGSFIRRYGAYIEDGAPLDACVEFTLKDDDRGDPLITREALVALDILTGDEYDAIARMQKRICGIIRDAIAEKGGELYDIKLEFGRVNGEVLLIDEISAGGMRVYKDGKSMEPLALADLILG